MILLIECLLIELNSGVEFGRLCYAQWSIAIEYINLFFIPPPSIYFFANQLGQFRVDRQLSITPLQIPLKPPHIRKPALT